MVRLAALRRGALTFAVPIGPEDPVRYFVCNILGAIGDVQGVGLEWRGVVTGERTLRVPEVLARAHRTPQSRRRS